MAKWRKPNFLASRLIRIIFTDADIKAAPLGLGRAAATIISRCTLATTERVISLPSSLSKYGLRPATIHAARQVIVISIFLLLAGDDVDAKAARKEVTGRRGDSAQPQRRRRYGFSADVR